MLNVLQTHHCIFLHIAKLKILKQASPMDMIFVLEGGTCPKIKAGACVETTLVIPQYDSKSDSSTKKNANIGQTLIRTNYYVYEKSAQ